MVCFPLAIFQLSFSALFQKQHDFQIYKNVLLWCQAVLVFCQMSININIVVASYYNENVKMYRLSGLPNSCFIPRDRNLLKHVQIVIPVKKRNNIPFYISHRTTNSCKGFMNLLPGLSRITKGKNPSWNGDLKEISVAPFPAFCILVLNLFIIPFLENWVRNIHTE